MAQGHAGHPRHRQPISVTPRHPSDNRTCIRVSPGGAVHVQFSDPYCPAGRSIAIATGHSAGWIPAGSGTLVVIDGPRFSTRAESRWYAAQGWTLIGMTGHPEAVLARELALCYTAISLVTDTDAGVEEGEGVTHHEVMEVFAQNVARLRGLLMTIIENMPEERTCPCPNSLDGLKLPIEVPWPGLHSRPRAACGRAGGTVPAAPISSLCRPSAQAAPAPGHLRIIAAGSSH
jgi:hypothetical protein